MNVWIQDADQVDFSEFNLSNVFITRCVKNFLHGEKILGITASRGIGKTFLLKARRMIEQSKSGIACLPEDAMLATLARPSIDGSAKNYLQNYNNWVFIWESAIFAAVMNCLISKKIINLNEISDYPLHYEIICSSHSIEDIFCLICSKTKKFLHDLAEEYTLCRSLFRKAQYGISIFIDRLDQAFASDYHLSEGQTASNTGPSDMNYWKFAQISLAQASYRVNAINSQIKVFYSIRKEALINASKISQEYQNFVGSIEEISYSKNELEEMFHSYIYREANENLLYPNEKMDNPEKAFLGLDSIPHQYIKGVKETVFDYMYRHTFGRPRDIMHICSNLYSKLYHGTTSQLQKVIRHGVNQGSMFLLENYIIELEPFFYQLNRINLDFLCQGISSNALDKAMMDGLCYDFNKEFEKSDPPYFEACIKGDGCLECKRIHPLCQLYNIGLLGYLHESAGGEYTIRFQPYGGEEIVTQGHLLPASKMYFLHPALSNKVEKIRRETNRPYMHTRSVIGYDEVIEKKVVHATKRRLNTFRKKHPTKKIFISSTCYDLEDSRKAIKDLLRKKGFEVLLSEDYTFNQFTQGVHTHDHCINELLQCDYLIFIVSGRYGGEYQGRNYLEECTEIEKISRSLTHPSISLMEFYVAHKNKIPMSVFIDEKVSTERNIYNRQKDKEVFTPVNVSDTRVFDIITFLTKHVNVWRQEYRNLEHLQELINIALPL